MRNAFPLPFVYPDGEVNKKVRKRFFNENEVKKCENCASGEENGGKSYENFRRKF